MSALSIRRNDKGEWVIRTSLRGQELLTSALANKGTAYTPEERERLGLQGLLPAQVATLDQQVERALVHLDKKTGPLDRYIFLAALQNRSETLYYALLNRHLEKLLPVIYTPTVGEATQKYSRIFRHTRGIWVTPHHRGKIAEVLRNVPCSDVRLVVATDNERILGLGDQGAGGMGIPIGKLSIYTVAAGIHPSQTLPVSLDVGTDNADLRNDPLYLGYAKPRLRGPEYHSLVDEFVEAVKTVFPRALLQWEDFKKQTAFDLLDRHRDNLLSFNDDIEGTAAVALAGIEAGLRITHEPLGEQRILILGAGAAGVGIARLIRTALTDFGLSEEESVKRVALFDSRSVVHDGREGLDPYKLALAWPAAWAHEVGGLEDPESFIKAFKPTVLIGTTGHPGTFTEPMVRAMAKNCAQPMIFPYSNPTSKAEAHPRDLLEWTNGGALVASGSPFGTIEYEGRKVHVGQGNNAYIFPGVGLAALAVNARRITPSMFAAASAALAAEVADEDLAKGSLYPPVSALWDVTEKIAVAVARVAVRAGLTPLREDQIESAVHAERWRPCYPPIEDV